MFELITNVNTDYIITRYLFLEKVLTMVLISFLIET